MSHWAGVQSRCLRIPAFLPLPCPSFRRVVSQSRRDNDRLLRAKSSALSGLARRRRPRAPNRPRFRSVHEPIPHLAISIQHLLAIAGRRRRDRGSASIPLRWPWCGSSRAPGDGPQATARSTRSKLASSRSSKLCGRWRAISMPMSSMTGDERDRAPRGARRTRRRRSCGRRSGASACGHRRTYGIVAAGEQNGTGKIAGHRLSA